FSDKLIHLITLEHECVAQPFYHKAAKMKCMLLFKCNNLITYYNWKHIMSHSYVINKCIFRHFLFVAQKLGLVASPTERLTEDEWTQVTTRSILQEESAKLCAVRREEFCLHAQMFLSCSHVFHRNCMQAFEQYSGRERHCATRIQAYWRVYVACKKVKKYP
uniref:Uncharacterized protein n=1 Tax=Poecilia latipinna TaxID=48699 RepID=A0A3B3TZW3_9TELE